MAALSSKTNSLFLFRKDLRLFDNPGLWHAVTESQNVFCLYIYQDESVKMPWPIGAAQKWWLHHSLKALQTSLEDTSSQKVSLLIKKGDPLHILDVICKQKALFNIGTVYVNHVFEPFYQAQQLKIKNILLTHGINFKVYNASLLIEPDVIKTQNGSYFKVFTPYWRACMNHLLEQQQSSSSARKLYDCPAFKHDNNNNSKHLQTELAKLITIDTLADLNLLPRHPDWASGFRATWTPGEANARQRLADFISHRVLTYDTARDNVFSPVGTSRLSPSLALGEIGPWQIWHTVFAGREFAKHLKIRGKERYIAELGWREFSYYLLYHFPGLPEQNFRPEFDKFQWATQNTLEQGGLKTKNEQQNTYESRLEAWKYGKTGYPIVDAGMKQLWYEGYMHNRVRMITASFLTKDLLVDWRTGAAWFWDTLVDADLANNSMGWQWVAGTGADASPYFRVFNPVLQGTKFDPNGQYVRQWLTLAHTTNKRNLPLVITTKDHKNSFFSFTQLPDKYIHAPWQCPPAIAQKCGFVLGVDYPRPIVDHEKCRAYALKVYQALRNTTSTFTDSIPADVNEKMGEMMELDGEKTINTPKHKGRKASSNTLHKNQNQIQTSMDGFATVDGIVTNVKLPPGLNPGRSLRSGAKKG